MQLTDPAKALIDQRQQYVEEMAPMYYAATPGDIHHRERVINFSSAMLKYFGQCYTSEEAEFISTAVIENQVGTEFDISHLFEYQHRSVRDELLLVDRFWDQQITAQQNRIYCSYHLGSYRLIVGYLLSKGIDVALLVTDDVIQKQMQLMTDVYRDMNCKDDFGKLIFLNAESFDGINEAINFYEQGGSLLIYIDGNSGIGGMNRNDDRLLTIPFLGRRVKARKGVAFLSWVLKATIYPFYVRNNQDGTRSLIFETNIVLDRQLNKVEYIKQTTHKLFQILEREVRREPAAWEGWLYIQKVTCVPQEPVVKTSANQPELLAEAEPDELVFNHHKFAILKYPAATVLMNIERFKFQILSAAATRAIRFVRERQNVFHVVRKELVAELIKNEIILQEVKYEN